MSDGGTDVVVRPLTADDALELDRIGYERGEQLHARGAAIGTRSLPADRRDATRHGYRVDTTSPLVVEGRVLLEESVAAPRFGQVGGARVYRFLDAAGAPLTVRDLRRFRVLVEAAL